MSGSLESLLSDECVEAYVRYLGAFKIVESDYGLFDKLARPRDFEDFVRVVYESVRVQDRVLERLREGVSGGEFEIVGYEAGRGAEDVERIFRIGKTCLLRIIELARGNPRLVGSLIASLALAYEGIKVRG